MREENAAVGKSEKEEKGMGPSNKGECARET